MDLKALRKEGLKNGEVFFLLTYSLFTILLILFTEDLSEETL
jgi:hypothetical protein